MEQDKKVYWVVRKQYDDKGNQKGEAISHGVFKNRIAARQHVDALRTKYNSRDEKTVFHIRHLKMHD